MAIAHLLAAAAGVAYTVRTVYKDLTCYYRDAQRRDRIIGVWMRANELRRNQKAEDKRSHPVNWKEEGF